MYGRQVSAETRDSELNDMVNIEELSAKELYELAKKKEQEEARLTELQEQISGLEDDREALIAKYNEELAETDRQIEELGARRKSLSDNHQKVLAALDKKIQALSEERQAKKGAQERAAPAAEKKAEVPAAEKKSEAPAAAKPKAPLQQEELPPPEEEPEEVPEEPPAPAPKGKTKGESEAEQLEQLLEHLKTIMKGRSYISDSLLREKLRAANFKPANLGKLLDTLVRQAKLVRRSGGNYVLGRIGKKK